MPSYTDYHFMNQDLRELNERGKEAQAKMRADIEARKAAMGPISPGMRKTIIGLGVALCFTVVGIPAGIFCFVYVSKRPVLPG